MSVLRSRFPPSPESRKMKPRLDLAVVIPTFNESLNVAMMVERLQIALQEFHWEVIFVDDDSSDNTYEVVSGLAQHHDQVRCVHRIGRRGLSSAVIEGILATTAPIVVVMDGDGQHDETVVGDMVRLIAQNQADVVVGSRYMDGGSVGQWDKGRARMSRMATRLAGLVLRGSEVSDPMSGFFAISRKSFYDAVRQLSGEGFKILLDIIASARTPLRVKEVPYTFRNRIAGESKLDSSVVIQYLLLILEKRLPAWVPVRLIPFVAVGASGVFVHFAVLGVLHRIATLEFALAHGLATIVAMTSNFLINNSLTYRDQMLRGARFWRGLVSFYAICGVGAMANLGVATSLFAKPHSWVFAALAGIVVGTVWNFAMSRIFTWGKKR
jgi:dolichol-phosphate mannosyltransferase